MLELSFSNKLDWGSYIVPIVNTASKKIGALIHSMKFLSPEVALCLQKSSLRPCMKYCCNVWVGAPGWYLEMLDKLQKLVCRTVDPSLVAPFNPWLIAEMQPALIINITLEDVHLNWLNW